MSKEQGITDAKSYRSYPINNGIKKDFTCYTKTLDQVIDQVEYAVTKHSKALFTRLDIRNEAYSKNQLTRKDMTRIIENSKRAIERKYKNSPNKPDMNITWTTENDGEKPHFHLFISVNANAIQNGYAIKDTINQVVKKYLETDNDGLVEYCQSNGKYGKRIDRNASDFYERMDEAVYMASYLAKTNTKDNKQKGARVSSTSRLPKDWKENAEYQAMITRKNAIAKEEHLFEKLPCRQYNKMQYNTEDSLEDSFSIAAPPELYVEDNEDDHDLEPEEGSFPFDF